MNDNFKPQEINKDEQSALRQSICINENKMKAEFYTNRYLERVKNRMRRKGRPFPVNLCSICKYRQYVSKDKNGHKITQRCGLSSFLYKDKRWAGLYVPNKNQTEEDLK